MFRIVRVSATSATRLQGRYNKGTSRLYRTVRHYSKEQQKSELCPPPPPKKTNTGTLITFGTLALVGGGVIVYAKQNEDFRCNLVEIAPFMDDVIKFVYQEEKTYWASIRDKVQSWKDAVLPKEDSQNVNKRKPGSVDQPEKYKPPSPVLAPIAKDSKIEKDLYAEVRLESKPKDEAEPNVEIVGEKQDPVVPDTHPKNLAELEKSLTEAAKNAIDSYHKAVTTLKMYAEEVEVIIDLSTNRLDQSVWERLQEITTSRDEALKEAEKQAHRATKDYNRLKGLLNTTEFDVKESVKNQALRNIGAIADDLKTAKDDFEMEKRSASVTEKYWKKVKEARKHFGDELTILFPTMDIKEKKVSIPDGDLDLFVLHAMAKVLYYQKELHRLETVGSERLQKAVESARKGGLDVLTTQQICDEVEKHKRDLQVEFDKKCLKLRTEGEGELRKQLKLQSEAFTDHLGDAMRIKEAEIEKDLTRQFDEKLFEERCRYKEELAAMVGRLRGLDHALKARSSLDKNAHQNQVLWAACQALYRAVKASCPGFPWSAQIRPLDPEIKAVKLAASDTDELVTAVLEAIPNAAKNRGVYPEDALRERFLKVEKLARGVALVPEDGGGLHLYFLSYLQSLLLLKAANPIPQSELNDDETDFSKLSTYEILQRARYWLDRGDFSQTLKYMNLLQGAPRAVARQWMEETKILLETQQAATTLMAHATATGLVHL